MKKRIQIIPPNDVTIADLKRYREEHDCTLIEAMRALDYKGYRIETGRFEWVADAR